MYIIFKKIKKEMLYYKIILSQQLFSKTVKKINFK